MSAYLSLPITVLAVRSGPQSDDADAAGKDLAGRDLLVALARVPDPLRRRNIPTANRSWGERLRPAP